MHIKITRTHKQSYVLKITKQNRLKVQLLYDKLKRAPSSKSRPLIHFTLDPRKQRLAKQINVLNVHSASYQLIGRKSNPIFLLLKYLIECTVASIQQVEYVELE